MFTGASGDSEDDGRSRSAVGIVVWNVVFVVTIAALAAALTVLFRSMRAVMEVGGSCGSGGPYQVLVPCPDGIPLLMNGAIWGGVVVSFVAVVAIGKVGAPNLLWLLWPALFLSLGFNFFQFGLDPPGDNEAVVGWIVCGVLFAVMGGVPLLIGLPALFRGPKRTSALANRALVATTKLRNATTPPSVIVTAVPGFGERPRPADMTPRSSPVPGPSGAPATAVVADLERLATLHRSGALTDAEYRDAKDAVIRGGR